MTQEFDQNYWESHWRQASETRAGSEIPPNPYLVREISGLATGTALDAGCGEGAEAVWLAEQGWHVTAVDISRTVLARASERGTASGAPSGHLQWIEADLDDWAPAERFDLVTTHYAHPAMPQLAFYARISGWVAPGGTLLIVGHLHAPDTSWHGLDHGRQDHGHRPPAQASVTAAGVTGELDATKWDVIVAYEPTRTLSNRAGGVAQLQDVVVRATRRR